MSVWSWIFGLAASLSVNVFWGGIVGGVLYLVCQAFRKKKHKK